MPNPTNAFSRMRSKGGLYPADQWRPGQHYKAFDWSQHDQEDIPAEVRMQMHKESKGIRGPQTVKAARAAKGGLYPADQWRPGQHYKAFDWSQHDQEDIPAEVRMQMHKESKGIRGPQTVKAARADMKSTAYKTGARPTQFLDTLKKRRGE